MNSNQGNNNGKPPLEICKLFHPHYFVKKLYHLITIAVLLFSFFGVNLVQTLRLLVLLNIFLLFFACLTQVPYKINN